MYFWSIVSDSFIFPLVSKSLINMDVIEFLELLLQITNTLKFILEFLLFIARSLEGLVLRYLKKFILIVLFD